MEIAVYIGQHAPHLAAGQQMEDLIIALIVFQGSPAYVKNPFLRSRMAEVSSLCKLGSPAFLKVAEGDRGQGQASGFMQHGQPHMRDEPLSALLAWLRGGWRLCALPSMLAHTRSCLRVRHNHL